MKAYLRIVRRGVLDEIELQRPLAAALAAAHDHLGEPARRTLERLARIDRERERGEHVFALAELLELVAAAYAVLADPPQAFRRARRLAAGPHPGAARVAVVLAWLRERGDGERVGYDLWTSQRQPG